MNLAPQRASITGSLFCHSVRMDIVTWPMWTLASVPQGFSEAPRTPVWSLDWGQHASHESPLESCIQGPLGQPVQATGCIHYRGGCCLQPLHTGPPRGKEHSRLNWLQKYFFFQVRKLYTMLYVNYTTIKLGAGRGMRKPSRLKESKES